MTTIYSFDRLPTARLLALFPKRTRHIALAQTISAETLEMVLEWYDELGAELARRVPTPCPFHQHEAGDAASHAIDAGEFAASIPNPHAPCGVCAPCVEAALATCDVCHTRPCDPACPAYAPRFPVGCRVEYTDAWKTAHPHSPLVTARGTVLRVEHFECNGMADPPDGSTRVEVRWDGGARTWWLAPTDLQHAAEVR